MWKRAFLLPQWGAVLLAVGLIMAAAWITRPQPLDQAVGFCDAYGMIEGTVIRSIPETWGDKGIRYRHTIICFREELGSQGAQELLTAMEEISCRRRWKLPFEKAVLYSTGQDSLSLSFRTGSRAVELTLLSGSTTLYDLGTSNRSYSLDDGAYEILAGVLEKYGIEEKLD